MSRYLIIDTEKVMQSALKSAIETLERYGIVSEAETMAKFKEVFEAGEKWQREVNHTTEWGLDPEMDLSFDEYSNTL